jgi:hypothetical protein
MAGVDDLINNGLILHGQPTERGRTFIVTGLNRSGTSLVNSILQEAGLFMGGQINDVVYQGGVVFSVIEQLRARPEYPRPGCPSRRGT